MVMLLCRTPLYSGARLSRLQTCRFRLSSSSSFKLQACCSPRRYATVGSDDSYSPSSSDFKLARQPPQNVAVLGGGITGLTAAFYLRRDLPDSSNVTLYEANDRLGGWIQSVHVPVKGQEDQKIRFETGPRMIKALDQNMARFDDLVLWELVC